MGRAVRAALVAMASTALGVMAIGPSAALAGGGPYHYPGCGVTLQSCINQAAGGDSVYVDTNGRVDETLSITSSLRLLAGAGFHPSVRSIDISRNTAGTVTVIVEGLRVTDHLVTRLNAGTGHTVTLRNLDISQASDVGEIGLRLSASVPSTMTVERVRVHTASASQDAVAVDTGDHNGTIAVRLESMRIDQAGVVGGAGIGFQTAGGGTTELAVRSSVIRDVARDNAGGAAGVTLHLDGTGTVRVSLAGLTIDRSHTAGIGLRNDMTGTGHLDLSVFDTIISRSTQRPIVFDPGGPITFRAGALDLWKNGQAAYVEGYPLGKGNLAVDPRYTNTSIGDLRLRAGSPLIDRGVVCAPAGVSAGDAAGRGRLAGASVDIGAYERGGGATRPSVQLGGDGTDVLVGTAGADILCGGGGPDQADGKGGADWIDGGIGPDLLTGGPGKDRILGSGGDDQLCGRDGAPGDLLDGGPGRDTATKDAGDTLRSIERSGCLPPT